MDIEHGEVVNMMIQTSGHSGDKLNILYLYLQKTYDHQTR